MSGDTLLEVKNLSVSFPHRDRLFNAVTDVSFSLEVGQSLGLVGESGAGKSITGFSLINLVSKPGFISNGSILFEGQELISLTHSAMRGIRGNRISMIFQDPMMTLNPVLTIGNQMTETLLAHRRVSRREALARAEEQLARVHISSPARRLKQYPHELSGGMRQRVVIAIALLTDPALIIADEPTTALDVTIQAEIMDLLTELRASSRLGLILISHDLGVVSQMAGHMAVMYAGRIVETGPTAEIIKNPLHPYTKGLLAALPQIARKERRLNQIPGIMPSLAAVPPGCAFNPRCAAVQKICRERLPLFRSPRQTPHRQAACHLLEPEEKP